MVDKSLSDSSSNKPKLVKSEGPKYFIDIEGSILEDDDEFVTYEEILQLVGWDASQGVIQIDLKTHVSVYVQLRVVVKINQGIEFSKKVRWIWGNSPFSLRL